MTTKTTHTPGPWKSTLDYESWQISRANVAWYDESQRRIADVPRVDDTDMLNARLIAAAPTLLAALQNLIVAAQYGSVSAAIQDARAAIALVKGEA